MSETYYQKLIRKAESLEQASLRAKDCEVKLMYKGKANQLRLKALDQPIGEVPAKIGKEFAMLMTGWCFIVVVSIVIFGILVALAEGIRIRY